MPEPITFNFPNLKQRAVKQKAFNKALKRKIRSDSGTNICIGCGEKKHDCSKAYMFQRSDSNGNEHHLGYVFVKENMYKDKLFTLFVDEISICEECQEQQ